MSGQVVEWLDAVIAAMKVRRASLLLTAESFRVVLRCDAATLPRRAITTREHEVLKLVAQGAKSHQVGLALFIGDAGVRQTICQLLDKLAFGSTVQLVLLWRTLGTTPKDVTKPSGTRVLDFELSFAGLGFERLSEAERDIVLALMQGKRNNEVALLRQVSPRTVANQLSKLFRQFGVSSRAALVARLLEPLPPSLPPPTKPRAFT